MRDYKSLAHTRWDCKYHIVFIPKRRRKLIYGDIRKMLGEIFHELARRKSCKIEEGHLMGDHVHICISIPPKYSVSNVVGYIKGKSAIAIARRFTFGHEVITCLQSDLMKKWFENIFAIKSRKIFIEEAVIFSV